MNSTIAKLLAGGIATAFVMAAPVRAEVSQDAIDALGAPDSMETSVGTLDFKDGAPSAETARKVSDALDFTNALNVYNNSFRGASALALLKGAASIGAKDNDVIIKKMKDVSLEPGKIEIETKDDNF